MRLSLFVSLFFLGQAYGYFYKSEFRSTLPFKGGMATAQRNNSLYLFGGESADESYSNSFYQLTQTTDSYQWSLVPQTNPPESLRYAKAVVANDVLYLFGGVSRSTENKLMPLQYYTYSFSTHAWTAGATNQQANATQLPMNRQYFSATYDGQHSIYLFGGGVNGTHFLNDFYKFDITTGTFTNLTWPLGQIYYYGHTASYLSHGQLVIVGGSLANPNTGQTTLAPVHQMLVYDTNAQTWSQVQAKSIDGKMPSTRTDHVAAVTSDNQIVVFGGDSGATMRQRMYLNALAVLDTSTWTWRMPVAAGIPPSRRSFASAGILDGQHLTVAFGGALNSYYNDVNVFDLQSNAWLQSFVPITGTPSSNLSGGAIAGIVIACIIVGILLLFLLWRCQAYLRWLFMRIHKDIWKPRTGEPLWAETTRIVFQIFLLFLFTVFLVFVIRQAIDSPNVTQNIQEASATVEIPDIRFCFDGFPGYAATDARATGVACSTDVGYSCNSYVQALDMSVFKPVFTDGLGAVACYLFKPSTDFRLTGTSGVNNGSRLLFTFFGDPTAYGRIHVSVYPQRMDPNALVYGVGDNNVLLTQAKVDDWMTNEINDLQVSNVYDIEPFTYSTLSYKLIDHRYLQSQGWNYVGFLPITNSTPEVETHFRQEAPNPTYNLTHNDLGVFSVTPDGFVTTIAKEVKMYTLVNALGFVGGIFGLLITIQAWLFGFRPRSPWGVVHRWSVGDMKRSLLNGLQSKFKITNSGIPLVHPVHHRFSMTDLSPMEESESQRVQRVEERMQMLEMLFKAYYVDDEVFRSLDDANRTQHVGRRQPLPTSSSSYTEGPKTEKVPEDHFMPSKPYVRQDTDLSSASHIPLTQRNYQHAPPYQPGTTLQIHEDD
ncbi:hypothetical protein BY458DRAFT_506317 [Sporodiniella umbellata]|nr:hypothetical protein BY458DRAFT_506317 [Sporodiniella umbellata]